MKWELSGTIFNRFVKSLAVVTKQIPAEKIGKGMRETDHLIRKIAGQSAETTFEEVTGAIDAQTVRFANAIKNIPEGTVNYLQKTAKQIPAAEINQRLVNLSQTSPKDILNGLEKRFDGLEKGAKDLPKNTLLLLTNARNGISPAPFYSVMSYIPPFSKKNSEIGKQSGNSLEKKSLAKILQGEKRPQPNPIFQISPKGDFQIKEAVPFQNTTKSEGLLAEKPQVDNALVFVPQSVNRGRPNGSGPKIDLHPIFLGSGKEIVLFSKHIEQSLKKIDDSVAPFFSEKQVLGSEGGGGSGEKKIDQGIGMVVLGLLGIAALKKGLEKDELKDGQFTEKRSPDSSNSQLLIDENGDKNKEIKSHQGVKDLEKEDGKFLDKQKQHSQEELSQNPPGPDCQKPLFLGMDMQTVTKVAQVGVLVLVASAGLAYLLSK